MISTLATSIKYEYKADVREYSIPYQYRECGDIKVHCYDGTTHPRLWIFREYTPLTEGTDYTISDDSRVLTLLTDLAEGTVIEIFRATVPLQECDFPDNDLCEDYEDSIDRNTLCIQEVHTWLHHLTHELRRLEHWVVYQIRKFEEDFESRLADLEDSVGKLHTADIDYVIQLVEYMMLLFQYAQEKLLTDLRYPISHYRERTRNKYGLETAILIVNAARVIRVDDEGECDV